MKRRTRVRLLSYGLAALTVMGAFLWRSEKRLRSWERYAENGWRRAFGTISADLAEIDTALRKCRVTGSEALVGEAGVEVYARAQEAQALLAELPLGEWQLDGITGYLGKLGDYALSLSRSAFRSRLSDEERTLLNALGEAASQLNAGLTELQAAIEDGSLSPGQLASQPLPEGMRLLGDDLMAIADEFPELPTLIYDGPYSESTVTGSARMLEGLETVSEADALRAAARFTERSETEFAVLARSEGTLPCYLVGAGEGSDRVTLRVTRQGGLIADMVSGNGNYDGALAAEEAVELAKAFLRERGYADLEDTYWTREEGTLLISFASVQEDWLCYPDLVKVRVSLSGGAVIAFDAVGYLMNHMTRTLPIPCDIEASRKSVNPTLRILSEGLAVIPTAGKQERFCREFKCEDEAGEHYIVYTDALSGEEVKLLLLLEDENGTLVL